jgi:choline dehydrogenase-like flavoprotein
VRIGIGIDEASGPITLDAWVERVRDAAERGFATWSAQFMNWDALTAHAVVGRAVPGIALGTAIVPTCPRHPLTLAGQALTDQAAIGNRLSLATQVAVSSPLTSVTGITHRRQPLREEVWGGTIMRSDPGPSVTIGYGQTHDVPNLFVAGPGLFPTGGAVNPTFAVHTLALRAVEYMVRSWSSPV